ncbi:delta-like protein D [Nematostella vectensis]|uniref:delta-like protein D n=1 Tax=Nematostella vectensis TaxID=45351 RepID=UPI0013902058|nr:delta-like protein D [Nematostella vectensis]XP_048576881.1 delta-like protein D [Nematostella vectensis]
MDCRVLLLSFVLALFVVEAESGGHVSVVFKRYRNPTRRRYDGHCCEHVFWSRCGTCDTYLKICLTDFANPRSIKHCPLGSVRTKRLGRDDFRFHLRITRAFTRFKGNIGLYVESWDHDTFTADDLVDKLSLTLHLTRPDPNNHVTSLYRRTLQGRRASLSAELNVYCDPHYYGTACATYCRARDDQYGHYTCNLHGEKVCRPTWHGANCLARCVEYDDSARGHSKCDANGRRVCREGWYGKNCLKYCMERDDHQGHYTCDMMGEKVCREGWYGDDCRIHCVPTESDVQGHYSCDGAGRRVCNDGWHGDKCSVYCKETDDERGHYTCGVKGQRVCHVGWALPNCKTCAQGYNPPNCTAPCVPANNSTQGHYTCDKQDNKKCRMWWHGVNCTTYCVPHMDPVHGHYTCDSHGNKTCHPGWYGDSCSKKCEDASTELSCQGLKQCKPGFARPDCTECEPGFFGVNCSKSCLVGKLGNVVCGASGERKCRKWWYGVDCDVYCVPHDDDTNGHFTCDSNGSWRCILGWAVPECKLKESHKAMAREADVGLFSVN